MNPGPRAHRARIARAAAYTDAANLVQRIHDIGAKHPKDLSDAEEALYLKHHRLAYLDMDHACLPAVSGWLAELAGDLLQGLDDDGPGDP